MHRKSSKQISAGLVAATALTVGLVIAAPAGATITQVADVSVKPATGTGLAKGKNFVKLNSYLATRDAASTRGTKKANPVGKVFMDFPVGSTVNKSAKPACNFSEYATPSMLSSVCSGSAVGTGWALLNTGSATAHDQLTGAAPACAGGDSTQYSRVWRTNPGAGPDCTPVGDIWVQITAYQGGVLKAQWWCYGDAGRPRPGAPCNNKAAGGDAKGVLLASGPTNGSFNDLANKKGLNGCNIIFANDNAVAPLAFGGTVTNCRNRLTVIIPSLNGEGAGLGELTGGFVLSDFYLSINAPNYLKAGACPASKKWAVNTQFVYSKLKGESAAPSPGSLTVKSESPCKV